MKSKTLLIATVMIFSFSLGASAQKSMDELWNKVDQSIKQRLPQTALEITEEIYSRARESGDDKNLLKALLYRNKLRADFQENFLVKSINEFKTELAEADQPSKQIMHSIIADLYWRYYLANRSAILDRTELALEEGNDFTEWGLNRIVEEVTFHYEASLENKEILKSTSIRNYSAILETEEGSDAYRPALYDFLAHRAVDFYMNEEKSVTRPAETFKIDDPAYFALASEFTGLSLPLTDTISFTYRALKVFSGILDFHLEDNSPQALIDADIKRLQFVSNAYTGADKDELYLATLKSLNEAYKNDPAGTLVSFELASFYIRLGDQFDPFQQETYRWYLKDAKDIAESAIRSFPESRGAINCKTLIPLIERKELSLSVPYANLPGKPFLGSLTFRNLDEVHVKIIRMDPDEDRDLRYRLREGNLLREYLKYKPELEYSFNIPGEEDFQSHVTEIKMEPLETGYYVVLLSEDGEFGEDVTTVYNHFWITRLSYINKLTDEGNEIFILDRETGMPIEDVVLKSFSREYDYSTRSYKMIPEGEAATGKDGYAVLKNKGERNKSLYVKFSKADDAFMSENYFYIRSHDGEQKPIERTWFFTDRAIYRPGQTVHFKGIMMESLPNEHVIMPGKNTVVTLFNRNGKKVEELSLQTNEYGSFTGSFTLPSSTLTGMFRLTNGSGTVYINVEEYKRPKFSVGIDPLQGTYKLGEEVEVAGSANSYSGVPVDNATVKYRIVRRAGFPFRNAWWFWPIPGGEEAEVTSGMTTTGTDGKFAFTFNAIPDHNIDKKYMPVFYYRIITDVTDINGETHTTEETVTVGYKSLLINAEVPRYIQKESAPAIPFDVTNLNMQKVDANVDVELYKLEGPETVLRERMGSRPDVFMMERDEFRKDFPMDIYDNENEWSSWERAELSYSGKLNTAEDSVIVLDEMKGLDDGAYLLVMKTTDKYGEEIETESYFNLFSGKKLEMPIATPFLFISGSEELLPGETASLLVGTSERAARVLVETTKGIETLSREWITISDEINKIDFLVEEKHRGGFAIEVTWVRSERSYQENTRIAVPFSNKELDISFETFRSDLLPGAKEEWKLNIKGEYGEPMVAEILASMYDASLDAFTKLSWPFNLYLKFSMHRSWELNNSFNNSVSNGFGYRYFSGVKPIQFQQYDRLHWFGFNYFNYAMHPGYRERGVMSADLKAMPSGVAAEKSIEDANMAFDGAGEEMDQKAGEMPGQTEQEKESGLEVPVRRSFEETAFFFPQLRTGEEGSLSISFTVPESLTGWRFMALAHDKELRTGYIEKSLVTKKELMVVPNYPRFLRNGDRLVFSTKIVSLSETELSGKATLQFFDAITNNEINDIPGFSNETVSFEVSAGKSQIVNWEFTVPDGFEAITLRVQAVAGSHTDGEELTLPVLPDRMLVTETLPLPVRGASENGFLFGKVKDAGGSKTLTPYSYTLEFTSNPAWYAVMALPYLMEPNYKSADAIFNKYYANSLASFIASSDPRIRSVFNAWKQAGEGSFYSMLEKNEELKGILLDATPWVLDAASEKDNMKRIALLFDNNRMAYEKEQALQKLAELQTAGGGWAWFRGMPQSRHMTQQIVTGIGRLGSLGVVDPRSEPRLTGMLNRAIAFLDGEASREYEEIRKNHEGTIEENHLSSMAIHYLYMRSLFPEIKVNNAKASDAIEYYMSQAKQFWTSKGRYEQGLIALVMHRSDYSDIAASIVRSLKENSLKDEEMGMYWRSEAGYLWNEAPVETQALMIEVFEEITDDFRAIEDMKVWLLKQKQTQSWHTNRSTADAIYALLLRGRELLSDDKIAKVTVGREVIDPKEDDLKIQAGTGYFKKSWSKSDIKPSMGTIRVEKETPGVAWGAAYYQYFETLDKIEKADSPLSVEKQLFREVKTPEGPELEPISGDTHVKVGDRIISRIIIISDRNLEYVHLKDMRASSFEPVNVMSGYKYQGGIGYYESPKDASTDFFIHYIRKGKYILEYPVFATQAGQFSNGITTIQCLYAPEFSAHSEGVRVVVK